MEDFNINLMNYETGNPTSLFLDNTCSNSFFPCINIPTRHTSRSHGHQWKHITWKHNRHFRLPCPISNHFLPST